MNGDTQRLTWVGILLLLLLFIAGFCRDKSRFGDIIRMNAYSIPKKPLFKIYSMLAMRLLNLASRLRCRSSSCQPSEFQQDCDVPCRVL
ncbi:hypothetical protein F5880DRAFT_561570 [Lentinula raphanica]|nr:hypothetical protein F5880DRAFT_561570 [Lentinula raphanica]